MQKKFKDPISLSVEGLPEGVKAEVKPVEGSQVEYLITLTGPPEIALGNHSIRITAQGTYQLQPQQAVIEDLTLQVVMPLVVTIEPAGPIAPGGRQKVGIRVRRFGEEKHPVVLTWSEAPAGIRHQAAASRAGTSYPAPGGTSRATRQPIRRHFLYRL